MASWQSYILKALMKLNKFFHRNDQKVDIQEFRDSFEQIGKIAYRKVKGVKETKTTIAGLDAFWFTSEKATNESPVLFFPRGRLYSKFNRYLSHPSLELAARLKEKFFITPIV